MEPTRIILEPQDIKEFTLLGLGLAFTCSYFPFLPFGMGISILCLSHHYILEKYNCLVSLVLGIVPRMNYPFSLTHM